MNITAERSLYDLSFSTLERELEQSGVRPFHARALWASLYRGVQGEWSPPLARWMEKAVPHRFLPEKPEIAADIRSGDGLTRKFLLRLRDGQEVESVLMGYEGRHTACISTQAGCAMGCRFCATGQMGFVRHLRAGEIVAQVLHCRDALGSQGHLRNLVLMGMGEPLHNYDAVMEALGIITDTRGLNIGPGRISVSTVGVVPGILRMAEEKRPYNLAVSLHGASEEERAALIPVSRKWPLADVIAACRTYGEITGRRIFFGWTLIDGVNDSPEQAAKLARLLTGIDAHVNLIPLNPTTGFEGEEASGNAGLVFQQVLAGAGIPSTVRQRRGIDVAAGCGQLKSERQKRRGDV